MKILLLGLRALAAAYMIAVTFTITGCSSCKPGKQGPPGKYNVEIRLDEALKQGSVLVDVVGVNAGTLPRWETYSMSKYWQHSDPMRTSAEKLVFDFSSGKAGTQTLAITNAIWNSWQTKGVSHLLLLADLPGGPVDKPGVADARRQMVPLDKCYWPGGTKKLMVVVKQSGLEIETLPRTAK
jgi:hypothetical protein